MYGNLKLMAQLIFLKPKSNTGKHKKNSKPSFKPTKIYFKLITLLIKFLLNLINDLEYIWK